MLSGPEAGAIAPAVTQGLHRERGALSIRSSNAQGLYTSWDQLHGRSLLNSILFF